MNKTVFLLLLSLMAQLSGINVFSQSDNVPGWRGPGRDGKFYGFKAPAVWPQELLLEWEVTVGLGDASPVLVDNRIYLLTSLDSVETLLCLDTKIGKTIWEVPINKAPKVTGGASSHPGPRSTPYVSNGKVFTLGAGGVVACHDAKKGKLIWKNENYTAEVPQFFTAASPLLTKNLCILPLGGKENGCVVAFDVNTGQEVWKASDIPCTYSSPVFADLGGTIIVNQSETDLVGITLDGQVVGRIPTPCLQRFYNSSTPIIDGLNTYVAGAGTGTIKFQINSEGGSPGYTTAWTNSKLGVSFNTPVLKDGYLYGNEARFGYLFCLNAETGETAWADTVKLNRFASMLDVGPVMMSLTGNAQLTVFEPNPNEFKLLARYKVSETEVYAHPIAVGNRIYIKDKEHLSCWVVK